MRGRREAAWLHDLVTADVEGLSPGQSRRSLLLTPDRPDPSRLPRRPAGRLLPSPPGSRGNRRPSDAILLPTCSRPMSSWRIAAERSVVVAVLGGEAAEDGDDGHRPRTVGARPGHDVIVPPGEPRRSARANVSGNEGSSRSPPRTSRHGGSGAASSGWGRTSGRTPCLRRPGSRTRSTSRKGCFLGQESVAKVRNLGHPPWVLRLVRSRRRSPREPPSWWTAPRWGR